MRKVPDDGYGGLLYMLFGIAVFVAFIWGIATLIAAVYPSHPVSPDVNIVMGSTVTAAFSLLGILVNRSDRKRRENGNGGTSDPRA